ncbi:MAG: hypothetical protein JWO13_1648 [Acidobacteriales bacterium]|nr:hypothetical protein [Terriglobales bacterium]
MWTVGVSERLFTTEILCNFSHRSSLGENPRHPPRIPMPSQKKSIPKKLTLKAQRAARAKETSPHPGLSFSHKHHVFICKVKRGEMWALNHLTPKDKATVTPLFEMWPPAPPRKAQDGEEGKAPKTLSVHASDLLGMVRDEWNTLPFFLDTRYVPLGGIPSPSSAKIIFDSARNMGLTAIPVTSIKFAPEFQHAIRDINAKDGRGVMIRLFIQDFINPALLNDYLSALLGVLKIDATKADILIDLEYKPQQLEVQQLGHSAVSVLPMLKKWRTVILSSGCFPLSISDFPLDEWRSIQRSDWLGWLHVNSVLAKAKSRQISYGDYGIRCGGTPKNIPNRPDPNIRYSAASNILVRKGPKVDGTVKGICGSLIGKSEFAGINFSQGDAEIAVRAARPGLPNNGQAEQWIQWCTNHHLALTASQIRNLP